MGTIHSGFERHSPAAAQAAQAVSLSTQASVLVAGQPERASAAAASAAALAAAALAAASAASLSAAALASAASFAAAAAAAAAASFAAAASASFAAAAAAALASSFLQLTYSKQTGNLSWHFLLSMFLTQGAHCSSTVEEMKVHSAETPATPKSATRRSLFILNKIS